MDLEKALMTTSQEELEEKMSTMKKTNSKFKFKI